MRTCFLWAAIFLATLLSGWADDVLFVRNNWKHRLYIKANGEWQGYVDPGKVAYMPQEGFVTEESGFQDDGSLKVEHSYGGWPVSGTFTIEGISAVFEEEGAKTVFYSFGMEEYQGGYKRWVFGYDPNGDLVPPSLLDTEGAEKMRQGRPPEEALELQIKGTAPVDTSAGQRVTGLAGAGGGKFSLMKSGGEQDAGQTFTNSIGMKMIRVPGDTFLLAATETTQAQWRAVMGNNPSHFQGDSLPVEQVSWHDAVSFCQKLTERERQAGKLPKGYAYALPHETQWEKACRAGTTGDYAGPLDAMAWHGANSGGRSHAVATKRANAWEFYDMHGNVNEWCANEIGFDGRAYRGGDWQFSATYCQSGHRHRLVYSSWSRVSYLGFRPALIPSK